MIHTRLELQELRPKALARIKGYDCRILVCSGTGCIATGSEKVYEAFCEICKDAKGVTLEFAPHDENSEDIAVGVKRTGCQGICELGPLVRIQKGDKVIQYTKVQPSDCQMIFDRSVVEDDVLDHLLYKIDNVPYKSPEKIPFLAKQTRLVLKNCGKTDA